MTVPMHSGPGGMKCGLLQNHSFQRVKNYGALSMTPQTQYLSYKLVTIQALFMNDQ